MWMRAQLQEVANTTSAEIVEDVNAAKKNEKDKKEELKTALQDCTACWERAPRSTAGWIWR